MVNLDDISKALQGGDAEKVSELVRRCLLYTSDAADE